MTTDSKYQSESRRRSILFSAAVFVVVLAGMASCKSEDEKYHIDIEPGETVQVDNGGGEVHLSVKANVAWSFNTDADWLTGTVTAEGILLKVYPNPNVNKRQTLLQVVAAGHSTVSKSVSVVQGFTFLDFVPSVVHRLDGAGATVDVAVDTNIEDWTVNVTDTDWLTVAKSDGGFTLTASKNEGKYDRTALVTIGSALFKLERVLEISQGANFVPFLNIEQVNNPAADWTEGTVTLEVATNLVGQDWTYVAGSNWVDVSRTDNGLALTFAANQQNSRTTTLQITSAEYPEINQQLQITQAGYIVFEDDFSYLTGGGLIEDIFSATGELRFDAWATAYGTTNGWTSTPSLDAGTIPRPWVYSRGGFVKFGKTSYNGDLITPALAIFGTKTIQVSFKACGYTSAGSATNAGTLDPIQYTNGAAGGHADVPNELNIEIIGPGTASQTYFVITNYPDDNRRLHGAGWLWQMHPDATRTFTVTGATSETQIRFIAGKKVGISTADGTTNGTYYTYRHGLDDVMIHHVTE